tara:strand:+ start:1883 stop:2053 length:171 start_codon:yes stop_codon:yes gene_type:complete
MKKEIKITNIGIKNIKFGNNVKIGSDATFSRVKICSGAEVGAGNVVTRDIKKVVFI